MADRYDECAEKIIRELRYQEREDSSITESDIVPILRSHFPEVGEIGEAATKADSMLSLLRHRAGIAWGTGGLPEEREVDAVIGRLRKALAARRKG